MRSLKTTRRAVIAAVLCTPLLSCPKEQPQSLLILDAAAMNRQTQCMVRTGTAPQFIWLNGVLDLAITNHYWMYPHFKNMLASIQEVSKESVPNLYPRETNYVTVHTATVHVNLGSFYSSVTQGSKEFQTMEMYRLDGFQWDTAVTVAPGQDSTTAIEVIPTDLGNLLDRLIRSYPNASNPGIWISVVVRLTGWTQDFWTVYSNEFKFPILVCFGCLIRPTTNDMTETPSSANIPCNPGQDEGVDDTFCQLVALHKDECFRHLEE